MRPQVARDERADLLFDRGDGNIRIPACIHRLMITPAYARLRKEPLVKVHDTLRFKIAVGIVGGVGGELVRERADPCLLDEVGDDGGAGAVHPKNCDDSFT